jgi:hypothetical protein
MTIQLNICSWVVRRISFCNYDYHLIHEERENERTKNEPFDIQMNCIRINLAFFYYKELVFGFKLSRFDVFLLVIKKKMETNRLFVAFL